METKRFSLNAGMGVRILRIVLGAVFIMHGLQKLGVLRGVGGISKVAGFFGSVGIPLAPVMAWIITILEIVGGALLIFGVATRIITVLLTADMIFALALLHIKQGWFASELALVLLAGLLAVFLERKKDVRMVAF